MWVYTADDFSEEELKATTFGMKFKDAEVAQGFKAAYDSARSAVASAGPSPVKAGAGAGAGAAAGAGAGAGSSATAGTDNAVCVFMVMLVVVSSRRVLVVLLSCWDLVWLWGCTVQTRCPCTPH